MNYEQLTSELFGISLDTLLSKKQKLQFIESTLSNFFELATISEIMEIKAAISAVKFGIVKEVKS